MKIVLQRVSEASVSVGGQVVGAIGPGMLTFLCIEKEDDRALVDRYATKIVELRMFSDEAGKMNRSIRETTGEILLISQFTLTADLERGRRPGFERAAPPDQAEELYTYFAEKIREQGIHVATGVFRAYMAVQLVNDGPVTFILDSAKS
jgi:D-tyrosyl-tRNA(Tyr) deacylase